MTGNQMHIGVDIDEVLAQFYDGFLGYTNMYYDTHQTYNDFYTYNFWEVIGKTREETTVIYHEYCSSPHFMKIKPFPDALEVIPSLSNQHELTIITARPHFITEQTKEWLNTNFPNVFENAYFANHFSKSGVELNKAELVEKANVDVMVEDSYNHAMNYHQLGIQSILLERPWNKQYTNLPFPKLKDWYGVRDWIERK